MKMRDYQAGCIGGLKIAERTLKENGIDVPECLKKEIRMREGGGINTALTAKELSKATEEIKKICVETMLTTSLYTLRDGFDFGKKRMQAFYDRFMMKAAMLLEGETNFTEVKEVLKQETGFDIDYHLGKTWKEIAERMG